MEKDPALRFQTVGELLDALQSFLGVSARPRTASASFIRPNAPRRDPEAATLVAASLDPSISSTGPRVSVRGVGGITDPTLSSSQASITTERRTAWTKPGVRAMLLGGGALLLGAAIWLSRPRPDPSLQAPSAAPAAPAPTRATFSMLVESSPAGAEVTENGKRFGITPVLIAIDKSSVKAGPRMFVVRRIGYQPYSLLQGPSEENVRIMAALVPDAPAPVASAATPTPAPTPPRAWPPPPPKRDAVDPAAAPADIRMQR
jgi:hypothetical protein